MKQRNKCRRVWALGLPKTSAFFCALQGAVSSEEWCQNVISPHRKCGTAAAELQAEPMKARAMDYGLLLDKILIYQALQEWAHRNPDISHHDVAHRLTLADDLIQDMAQALTLALRKEAASHVA